MRTVVALSASVMLCVGCVPPRLVIPEPSIPHQLAKPAKVKILVGTPDGKYETQTAEIPAGWWVVSDEVANGRP